MHVIGDIRGRLILNDSRNYMADRLVIESSAGLGPFLLMISRDGVRGDPLPKILTSN
jgi:hypothetical protein